MTTKVAISGAANVLGIVSYNYSIKFGEISRVIPFTRLTPVFTALIAAVFLSEQITLMKASGVLLVTGGSYLILEEKGTDWKQPLRTFRTERAPKIAALSALVYSTAAVADRYVPQAVDPKLYTFVIYALITASLSAYIALRTDESVEDIRDQFSDHPVIYLLTGIGGAIASYLIFFAFSRAEASRVRPVVQLQVFL